MHADSHYIIGDSHRVCQDYTLHGIDKDNNPYIFVSDGCSSAKNTDFGARILCHTAKLFVDDFFNTSPINLDNFWNHIKFAQLDYELTYQSMYATLLMAKCYNDKILSIITGDGIIAGKRMDGEIIYNKVEFSNSAPYYLLYDLEDEGYDNYTKQFGDKVYDTEYTISIDGQVEKGDTECQDCRHSLIVEFDLVNEPKYDSVALFSDGVTSFIDENKKPIHESVIIKELLDFKTTKGEFVHRRMNAAVKKWKKMGWSHHDDLSMAVIVR